MSKNSQEHRQGCRADSEHEITPADVGTACAVDVSASKVVIALSEDSRGRCMLLLMLSELRNPEEDVDVEIPFLRPTVDSLCCCNLWDEICLFGWQKSASFLRKEDGCEKT